MIPRLRVEHLTKRYRRGREIVTAVDDATFDLADGALIGLVGPSGSGKTTLLNLLVRGEKPDEGQVTGLAENPSWHDLAVVPQSLGLLPELTMSENIGLPRRLGAIDARPTREVMDLLGIGSLADRPPSETSLGEQQRAAVARALVVSPVVLIADEPTSHQDDANTRRVTTALAEMAKAGSCVLLSTHDRRVIDQCDRLLRMHDGTVTADEQSRASARAMDH